MAFVNFDALLSRFSDQIYGSRKGRLRMQLIDTLYRRYLPSSDIEHWRVLDAAGGLGQMSYWFAQAGAQVDYFDVSAEMVASVNDQLSDVIAAQQVNTQQASILEFEPAQAYDFVNAHAVFEWLEQPYASIEQVLTWVKPGGYIGLMVYNEHMLMLRHLMRGTLSRAMSGEIAGLKGGLTPISPLNPDKVDELLTGAGFTIQCRAGLRSFSDLAERTVVEWYDEQDVFNAELKLCQQPPYRDMARYVLFIAQKSL